METIPVIINKHAHGGRAWGKWQRLKADLNRRGISFREYFTNHEERALPFDEILGGAPRAIAVAGGDGTLNQVINGLAKIGLPNTIPLLPIPIGRANDFARTLDLTRNPEEIVQRLRSGQEKLVDIGRVRCQGKIGSREYYFCVIAGGGGLSELASLARGPFKRFPARWAYGLSLLTVALKNHRWKVRIKHPEGLIQTELHACLICNVPFAGGGLRLTPQFSLEDGLAELIIIPALTLGEKLAGITRLFLKASIQNPKLIFRKISELEIESDPPLPFQIDGEIIETAPVRFETVPRSLRILV